MFQELFEALYNDYLIECWPEPCGVDAAIILTILLRKNWGSEKLSNFLGVTEQLSRGSEVPTQAIWL